MMPTLLNGGDPAMTVRTQHVTFRRLCFNRRQALADANHVGNEPELLTTNVMEFEHDRIDFAAVDTRMCGEVVSKPPLIPWPTNFFMPVASRRFATRPAPCLSSDTATATELPEFIDGQDFTTHRTLFSIHVTRVPCWDSFRQAKESE